MVRPNHQEINPSKTSIQTRLITSGNLSPLQTLFCLNQNNQISNFTTIFASYNKLLRIIAWILRFAHNSLTSPKSTGPLKATELNNAYKLIIKIIQNSAFESEIQALKNNKPLSNLSKFLSLNCFLYSDNILRVGGRLSHQQSFTFERKHSMLIPKNHPVTAAIIRYFHA